MTQSRRNDEGRLGPITTISFPGGVSAQELFREVRQTVDRAADIVKITVGTYSERGKYYTSAMGTTEQGDSYALESFERETHNPAYAIRNERALVRRAERAYERYVRGCLAK